MSSTPDVVVIGHVCRDLQADGTFLPGGTALYGALTALRLGCRVGIITAGDVAGELAALAPEAEVICQPSQQTTTFVNTYRHGRRTQHLRAVAPPIDLDLAPTAWWSAPVVFCGPLVQEIDPAAVVRQRPRWPVATAQGWLRRWDADGLVELGTLDMTPFNNLDLRVLVVSAGREAAGAAPLIQQVLARDGVVAITRGKDGSTIQQGTQSLAVPAPPVEEHDPTGAGDVYAMALVVRLAAGEPLAVAAAYASAAGALAVTAPGVAGVPDAAAIERLLRASPPRVVDAE